MREREWKEKRGGRDGEEREREKESMIQICKTAVHSCAMGITTIVVWY